MLARFLLLWALSAVAFAVTSWILPGMDVTGGVWGYLWVSALFGIVNGIIGSLLRVVTLPLSVLTLGLFSLIVTALMLKLTDALSSHLSIDEFWWTAVWAAVILALVTVALALLVQVLWARGLQAASDTRGPA